MKARDLAYLYVGKGGLRVGLLGQPPRADAEIYPINMPTYWWEALLTLYCNDVAGIQPSFRDDLKARIEALERGLEGSGEPGAWIGTIHMDEDGVLHIVYFDRNGISRVAALMPDPIWWDALQNEIKAHFTGKRSKLPSIIHTSWWNFPLTDELLTDLDKAYSAKVIWGRLMVHAFETYKNAMPDYFIECGMPTEDALRLQETYKDFPWERVKRTLTGMDLVENPIQVTETVYLREQWRNETLVYPKRVARWRGGRRHNQIVKE